MKLANGPRNRSAVGRGKIFTFSGFFHVEAQREEGTKVPSVPSLFPSTHFPKEGGRWRREVTKYGKLSHFD